MGSREAAGSAFLFVGFCVLLTGSQIRIGFGAVTPAGAKLVVPKWGVGPVLTFRSGFGPAFGSLLPRDGQGPRPWRRPWGRGLGSPLGSSEPKPETKPDRIVKTCLALPFPHHPSRSHRCPRVKPRVVRQTMNR